ncbi:glutaredoxin family protein [Desulfovibrio sp. TomC]|uniref:glutaredoxin family protein n=1 Tax=Desulfovibrio sp. TomC TaxID=1562888 RepID=UPI000575BA34|nr:glutaredoxin family protein [Desulfovibrio sp. TomC]KHK01356.1 glutaredoxin family protein [Desulfovibrio sp. TomC]
MTTPIKVFTLATCPHCTRAKDYLDEHNIPYDAVNVDFLSGEERNQVMDTVRKYNPEVTFPTIVIGSTVIVGFRSEQIEAALKELGGD